MVCPECGVRTVVKDSRLAEDEVYRLRVCRKCGKKIYTFEAIDESGGVREAVREALKTIHTKLCAEWRAKNV